MILSRQSILVRGNLITPMFDRSLHTESGLTFGLSPAGYDIRVAQSVDLLPGQFCLASSIERFDMPGDLLGVVHDKSTLARRGLALQNTVIEPGWHGYLTLELSNHGDRVIEVQAGQPIAQILFHLLDLSTDAPYAGRYQDQPNRPIAAMQARNGQ